ncbi:MAG: MtrB/PioB family outer membrane beta-barrel protein [Rhodocyclaceae bacterium]|nr:MtrB/PioB family outer membrane beta-barrel protein [Rhodocyclaceae bacterium]
MITNRKQFAVRVSVLAVHGALVAMACLSTAYADDEDATVESLTTPVKTLSVGVTGVDKSSAKFGEYNGLNQSGVYGDANVDLRGGGSWDSSNTGRWRVTGNNLTVDGNRDAQAEIGQQGSFRFKFGYDELTHYRSDTYQTPFQGVGTNNLTLPGNWTAPLYTTGTAMGGTAAAQTYPLPVVSFFGLAATSYTSPLVANTTYFCKTSSGTAVSGSGCATNAAFGGAYTTTGLPVTAANTAMLANNLADLNDFHNQSLSVKRTKYNIDASLELDAQWSFKAGFKHEDKTGLQAKGVVTGSNGPSAASNGPNVGGELAIIMPMLVDQKHDQYNLSLDFRNDKAFATIAYYGSYFHNNNPYMTVANPWGASTYNGVANTAYGVASSTITSEPDNMFNQVSLGGGYDLTPKTKLVADASYGRNTQNQPYILSPEVFGTPTGVASPATNNGSYVPVSSLNGAITTKSLDLKLTDKSIDKLRLSAAYKFDQRDNSTPVNTYVFADSSGPGSKNAGSANSVFYGATIPGLPAGTGLYSNDNIYVNRAYSKKINQINLDANYDIAKGQTVRVGFDWQDTTRYCNGSWTDCSFVDSAKEKTLRAQYRFTASEDVKGWVGYDYSQRHVDYNADAWMSLVPALNATNVTSLVAQGWTGSVLQFMKTYNIPVNGLLIPQNTTVNSAATGNIAVNANAIPAALASPYIGAYTNLVGGMSAQQVTNVYNLLFGGAQGVGAGGGSGNGALAKAYMGSNNSFQNENGLNIYNMASRNRGKLRGSLDWQANERVNVTVGGSYSDDSYPDSSFGLTSTKNWGLNLDAAFAVNDNLSLNGYYSYEDQKSVLASNALTQGAQNGISSTGTSYTTATGATGVNSTVQGGCVPAVGSAALGGLTQWQWEQSNLSTDSCWKWGSEMKDKTHTLGLAFTKKKFLSPKFDFKGDLSYTQSVSSNHMTGGAYQSNPVAGLVAGAPALIYINLSDLPDVTNKVWRLRLNGQYKVDKASSVRVSYMFAKLTSDDWGWQTTGVMAASGNPTTTGVVPTFEQTPSYKVQTLGVSYLYSF